MAASPLDSALLSPLFVDPQIADRLSDAASLRAMASVEAALARAQGRLGIIPAAAAARIDETCAGIAWDHEAFAASIAANGVPTLELVNQIRAAAGPAAGPFVHWGSTTQDIIDTGLVLQLREVMDLMLARLDGTIVALADLARAHRDTLMLARTHSQAALPTVFGLKAANWLAPLLRMRRRWDELRPRLLVLSCGGAAGTMAAYGPRATALAAALAAELDLADPGVPWHGQRDGMAEFAGWLSLLTGCLGKLAQDVVLLTQSEVGEVREGGGGGGSSTMPQKQNPVRSELMIAAARANTGHLAAMHQALIHEHERATHGWQLEWLSLPPMLALSGGALAHAQVLVRDLVVDGARMKANLDATNGLVLAEPVSFAIAGVLAKPEAYALVKAACRDAAAQGRHLVDVVAERLAERPAAAAIDWRALRDPASHLGAAPTLIERILAEADTILRESN